MCQSGAYSVAIALAEGAFEIGAVFTRNGVTGEPTATIDVTIDRSVLAPQIDAVVRGASEIEVAGSAAESAAQISVSGNGAAFCEAIADGSGAWSCSAEAQSDGVLELRAVQTDVAGNVSEPSQAQSVGIGSGIFADGFED